MALIDVVMAADSDVLIFVKLANAMMIVSFGSDWALLPQSGSVERLGVL
jgi:hypothetical protein